MGTWSSPEDGRHGQAVGAQQYNSNDHAQQPGGPQEQNGARPMDRIEMPPPKPSCAYNEPPPPVKPSRTNESEQREGQDCSSSNGQHWGSAQEKQWDAPSQQQEWNNGRSSGGGNEQQPYPAPSSSDRWNSNDKHSSTNAGKRGPTIAEACESVGRGDTSGNTVKDDDVTTHDSDERPVPVQRIDTFDQADFPREIISELKRAGFPGPSQIQAYTWPIAISGKDVIGVAATGSGKTLAFLLPAFSQMMKSKFRPGRDGPGLLVMSPTRELAQQIENEAVRFGEPVGLRSVSMYGGATKRDQIYKYRGGVHTVVACPGRLNDFLESDQVRLDKVTNLVLDEADRMLDMGFEPQIRKILERLPRQRQTLFFSATWPKEVRKLASEILYKPYKVMIGNRDLLKGNQDVIQQARMVDEYSKDRALVDIMNEAGLMSRESSGKALVFANTKKMCEKISNKLYQSGLDCASIHGDKDQRERDNALNGLKSGRIKVLVATDVAARGLDIKGVGLVVNYDVANSTEDYVHRIGRTGRAGAKGYAVTLWTKGDSNKARGVVEVMQRTNQEIPQEVQEMARYGGGGDRNRWSRGGNGGWGGQRGGWGGGGGWKGGKGGGKGRGKDGKGDGRGRSRSPRRW